MKKNIGTADRAIRVMVAIVLATLYFSETLTGTTGIILLIIAAVFLLTSLLRFCPLYIPLGINTCRSK